MKLGFWNRLAIVLGIGGPLILGTIGFYLNYSERVEIAQEGYLGCLRSAAEGDGTLNQDFCWEIWQENFYLPGWGEWAGLVGFSLALAAMLYLVIRLFVFLAQWVWRGKSSPTLTEE